MLFSAATASARTFSFEAADLNSLPTFSLNNLDPSAPPFPSLTIQYASPVEPLPAAPLHRKTEACLFLWDQKAFATVLDTALPASEDVQGDDGLWLALVENPLFTPNAVCGFASNEVVFSSNGEHVLDTLATDVITEDFLPGNPLHFPAPAGAPSGTGAVKTVRVLDHGACSRPQALAPFYQQILQSLVDKLTTLGSQGGASVIPIYGHMVTLLDREAESSGCACSKPKNPDNSTEGFILDARLQIDHILFTETLDVHVTAKFSFGLTNGILSIEQTGPITFVSNNGTGAHALAVQVPALLTIEFPQSFLDQTTALQTVVVPDITNPNRDGTLPGFNCDSITQCSNPHSPNCFPRPDVNRCDAAANALAELIGVGGEDRHYSPDEQTKLADSIGGGANLEQSFHHHRSLWSCGPDPSFTGTTQPPNVCKITIPAKRVNVHPNEVELVWFDDETEATNPALALFAATFAHVPGQPVPSAAIQARNELCAFDPTGLTFPFDRAFAAEHFTP